MRLFSVLFGLFFFSISYSTTLSNIVVFGDSLSDTGNLYKSTEQKLPSSPPYFEGHFSNGPIWIEQLLTTLFPDTKTLPMENFAFGGAIATGEDKFMNLDMEITMYLNGHHQKADDQSLYVIWIGANDYLKAREDSSLIVQKVNKSIQKGINRLMQKGARYFLVINLPDIGKSPAARAAKTEDLLSEMVLQHNQKLEELVYELNENKRISALYFDVHTDFSTIITEPEKTGFVNVQDNCLEQVDVGAHGCDNWLFFDSLHPTTKAHGLIADALLRFLEKAGFDIVTVHPVAPKSHLRAHFERKSS